MGRFEFDKRDVAYLTDFLADQLKNSQSLQEKKEVSSILQKMIQLEEMYYDVEEQVSRLPNRTELQGLGEVEEEALEKPYEPMIDNSADMYIGVARRHLTGAIIDFGDGMEGFMPEYLVQRLQISTGDIVRGTVTGTTPMGYTRYHYELVEKGGQEDVERVEILGLLQEGSEGFFIKDESDKALPVAPGDIEKMKLEVGDVVTVAYYQNESESTRVGRVIKVHDSECTTAEPCKRPEPRAVTKELNELELQQEDEVTQTPIANPSPVFAGQQILLIGGELRVRYRELIEWMGAKMVWSPGGDKGLNRLEGLIKQSHAVIMLTALMSHSAYRIAKEVATKHEIPIEYVHGKGIDTLERALQKISSRLTHSTVKKSKLVVAEAGKIAFSRPKPFVPEPLLPFTKSGKWVAQDLEDEEDQSVQVVERTTPDPPFCYGDVLEEWIGNFNSGNHPNASKLVAKNEGIFLYVGTSTDKLNQILHEGILPQDNGILQGTVELTNKWHVYQAYERVIQQKEDVLDSQEPHLCCIGVYVPYEKLAVSEKFVSSRYLERKAKSAVKKGHPLMMDWAESLGQVSSVSHVGAISPEKIVTISILSPAIVRSAMTGNSLYLKDVLEWEKGKGKGTLKTQQVTDVIKWYDYSHLHLLKAQLNEGFEYQGARVDEQGQVYLVQADQLLRSVDHDLLSGHRDELTSDWFYYFASQSLLLSNF